MTGVIINNNFYDISTGNTKIEYSSMNGETVGYSMYGDEVPVEPDRDKILQWLCPKSSTGLRPCCELDSDFYFDYYYQIHISNRESMNQIVFFQTKGSNSSDTYYNNFIPTSEIYTWNCYDNYKTFSYSFDKLCYQNNEYVRQSNYYEMDKNYTNYPEYLCFEGDKFTNQINIKPNETSDDRKHRSNYYIFTGKKPTPNICLFFDSNATSNFGENSNDYRFYYLKVYNTYEGTLLYHYVPCISNNVLGVKELVNNKFYPLLGDLTNVTYQE